MVLQCVTFKTQPTNYHLLCKQLIRSRYIYSPNVRRGGLVNVTLVARPLLTSVAQVQVQHSVGLYMSGTCV
jgi:hypothetical protein